MKRIGSVAFVGVGALSSNFAYLVSKNQNISCSAIVRNVDTYLLEPVTLNGEILGISYLSYDQASVKSWDLIILGTKTYHLKGLLPQLKGLIGSETQVLSLLNGMESEEIIASEIGWEHTLYSTVFGSDTYREGHRIFSNSPGTIAFGEKYNHVITSRVASIADFFDFCGIMYCIPENMELCLWQKFLTNVGINQVSTLYQMTYGALRLSQIAKELIIQAQQEVIDLANSMDIKLMKSDIDKCMETLDGLSENGRSSMLHDYWQGNSLELESFSGQVCQLGSKLGILTPVNELLYYEISKMLSERESK